MVRTLLKVWLLVVGTTSCSTNVGQLEIRLLRSSAADQDPFSEASFIRVRVDGPGILVGPEVFPLEAREAQLEQIPIGTARVITIEGLGPERNVVSRGQSGPLEIRSGTNQLELYIGRLNAFSQISGPRERNLTTARFFHSATLLTSGAVLLSGGATTPWRPEQGQPFPSCTSSAELIDGDALKTAQTSAMTQARMGHSASLLSSGNVLIAGGHSVSSAPADGGLLPADGSVPPSAFPAADDAAAAAGPVEVYQTDEGRFIKGASLLTPRSWQQAAVINDSVYLVGGAINGDKPIGLVERYNQGRLETKAGMLEGRRAFTLTLLTDGSLLAIGGLDSDQRALSSVERWQPETPSWQRVSGLTLKYARAFHTATLLDDGTVLVTGGLTTGGPDEATPTIERLDPQRLTVRRKKPSKRCAGGTPQPCFETAGSWWWAVFQATKTAHPPAPSMSCCSSTAS